MYWNVIERVVHWFMENVFTTNVDDAIIEYMSRSTGMKYSDEQLKILRHHGGMCILASAGSGKTSILTHLIAKRIQTKEIHDASKLLCTTFSRGGAGGRFRYCTPFA